MGGTVDDRGFILLLVVFSCGMCCLSDNAHNVLVLGTARTMTSMSLEAISASLQAFPMFEPFYATVIQHAAPFVTYRKLFSCAFNETEWRLLLWREACIAHQQLWMPADLAHSCTQGSLKSEQIAIIQRQCLQANAIVVKSIRIGRASTPPLTQALAEELNLRVVLTYRSRIATAISWHERGWFQGNKTMIAHRICQDELLRNQTMQRLGKSISHSTIQVLHVQQGFYFMYGALLQAMSDVGIVASTPQLQQRLLDQLTLSSKRHSQWKLKQQQARDSSRTLPTNKTLRKEADQEFGKLFRNLSVCQVVSPFEAL
eukprot:m.5532 g.5532  ORF g.5532 m.5532 type:complete len:315 (-) comp5038_c0_seq1:54-998(-)